MHFAFPVLYFPMLRGVIEFDVSGAVSFQPPKFMQRDSFSPEALSGSVGLNEIWVFIMAVPFNDWLVVT